MVAGGTCWIGKWENGEGLDLRFWFCTRGKRFSIPSLFTIYLLGRCHISMVADRFLGSEVQFVRVQCTWGEVSFVRLSNGIP